jgi:hypothetical protein
MPHDQAYYEAEKKIEQALKSGTTKLEMIHPTLHPKRNSPSPIWGKLEGGSHAP